MLQIVDPANLTRVLPDAFQFFGIVLGKDDFGALFEISYAPLSGPENSFGNRNCEHYNVHGTCFVNAEDVIYNTPASSSPTYFYYFDGVERRDYVCVRCTYSAYTKQAASFIFPNTGFKRHLVISKDLNEAYFIACNTRNRFKGWFFYIAFMGYSFYINCVYFDTATSLSGDILYYRKMTQAPQLPDQWVVRDKVFNLVRVPAPTSVNSWCNMVQCQYRLGGNRWQNTYSEISAIATGFYNYLKGQEISTTAGSTSISIRYNVASPARTEPYLPSRLIAMKKAIFRQITETSPLTYDVLREEYGLATEDAVDRARNFSGNGIAYLKELGEIKDTIKSLISLLTGRVTPKALANLWLSYRYGLRLTAKDTEEIATAFSKAVSSKRQTHNNCALIRGKAAGNDGARCIIYYAPSQPNLYFKLVQVLMDWDLLPDFTNIWDLIPFSFVVDWFVDVEGAANAVDVNTYLHTYDIKSCLYTKKSTWRPVSPVWAGMGSGDVLFSHFRRMSTSEPYYPLIRLSGSLPSNKNIIDGLSLLIASRK